VESNPFRPGLVDRPSALLGIGCVVAAQRGGERLECSADGFRAAQQLLARQLLAPASPVEEAVARGPATPPQRLGLRVRRGPAALPLGLKLLDCGGRRLPVRGVGERFRLLAERRFLVGVPAPLLVQATEVLAAAREEPIARLPELAPERRRV